MARDEKLELLATIPLFAGFGRRQLERLGQLADEVDVPAGHVLMRQGDAGREAFVIVDGTARVEREGRVLGEWHAGAVLGEIAVLLEGKRTATVTMTTPARLLVIGHREFHALMDELPEVRASVLAELARRVRGLEPDAAH